MTNKIINLKGEQGCVYLSSAEGVVEGNFNSFLVLQDCTIDTIEQRKAENISLIQGLSLPLGFILYGDIKSISISSGLIQLYYSVDPTKAEAIDA